MRSTVSGTVSLVRSVVATTRETQLTFLAAAIAYYAFVSFVPFLLLALSVASLVGGESFSNAIVSLLSEFLTAEARRIMREALRLDAAAGGATLVGLAALTWSSLRLFRGIDTAFSLVYGTTEDLSLLDKVRDGLLVLVAVVVGVTAVGLAGAFARRFAGPLASSLAGVTLLATLMVVLLPLYYVFPGVEMTVRDALPGAVLAALGWSLLGGVFQVYAQFATTSVYGVLGAALLVVTWLYFGAVIVLLGAAVNATLSGHPASEDRKGQHPGLRQIASTGMADEDTADDADAPAPEGPDREAPDPDLDPEEAEAVRTELDQLWDQLDDVEGRLDEKTVSRSEFRAEMRRYVRKRQRRGHARGWGPYLVLLYGTAMTLGAFFYLQGLWAVLAMVVVWLSTLGLYVVMVAFGAAAGSAAAVGGRVWDAVDSIRS